MRKGYTEIKMALGSSSKDGAAGGTKNAEDSKENNVKIEIEESKLHPKIQDLMEFIFDKKLMEESVIKVGYDVKRLPLGELS